jgi:hypothetical protein
MEVEHQVVFINKLIVMQHEKFHCRTRVLLQAKLKKVQTNQRLILLLKMISSLVPAASKNMLASILQVLLTKRGIRLEQELAQICPLEQAEEQAITQGLESRIALSRHNMNLQFMGLSEQWLHVCSRL